jgi:hypothetical protein
MRSESSLASTWTDSTFWYFVNAIICISLESPWPTLARPGWLILVDERLREAQGSLLYYPSGHRSYDARSRQVEAGVLDVAPLRTCASIGVYRQFSYDDTRTVDLACRPGGGFESSP